MKNLNSIIENMTLKNLKESLFFYEDNISIEEGKLLSNTYKYYLWKYYTGSITESEHNNIKNNINAYDLNSNLRKVYNAYEIIFNKKGFKNLQEMINFFCNENTKYLIETITDLWLMKPDNFEYKFRFELVIFSIYLATHDNRFKHIAFELYNSEENFIEISKNYKDSFLICNKNDEKYNNIYGIEGIKIEEHHEEREQKNISEKIEKDDWITERFGDF